MSPIFIFDVGNSNTGPVGYVARIRAASPEAALARLRGLLPEYQLVDCDGLQLGEYINVYFNWEDQPTLDALDDAEHEDSYETDE